MSLVDAIHDRGDSDNGDMNQSSDEENILVDDLEHFLE